MSVDIKARKGYRKAWNGGVVPGPVSDERLAVLVQDTVNACTARVSEWTAADVLDIADALIELQERRAAQRTEPEKEPTP